MTFKKALSCLFLFACASCLPPLHGPVIENIGADPFAFMMFNDGNNIVATFRDVKAAEIY